MNLCQTCGLCCDGTLFEDVELKPSEDPRAWRRLGFTLWRRGRKTCFSQPCHAFDGVLCGVYDTRPKHCRLFECHVLRRLENGEIDHRTARRTLRQAKRELAKVRRLIEQCGVVETGLPLGQAYTQAMLQPIDLTGGRAQSQAQSRLLTAMSKLMRFLDTEFRGL